MLVQSIILFFIILICYQWYFLQPTIEGLCPDESIKDHDAIIEIQSELNNKYKQLITDSEGKPVNIISRLNALEADVSVITTSMVSTGKSQVTEVTTAAPDPQVEPLPEGN
jgi:hypothetical protein